MTKVHFPHTSANFPVSEQTPSMGAAGEWSYLGVGVGGQPGNNKAACASRSGWAGGDGAAAGGGGGIESQLRFCKSSLRCLGSNWDSDISQLNKSNMWATGVSAQREH